MVRTGATFASLTVSGGSTAEEREQVARRVLDDSTPPAGPGAGDIGFPMVVAGEPIGVLGVASEPSLTEHQRSVLAAAAALLAVSLKNAELFREVRESSVRDVLTGCVNRRHAMEVMDAELRRARRSRLPISLVMFDLDHFKAINDSAGHLGGDAVLASIGQRMHAVLRGSDLKCRYGGEEFLILLPDTPLAGAQRVAETLRKDFEANPVRWNGVPLRVTASFGLAAVLPGEIDPLAVIARADAALYSAKQAGRNCVRIAEARVAIV
jgi:diguanylate cyclase (GGDEF)-like protein